MHSILILAAVLLSASATEVINSNYFLNECKTARCIQQKIGSMEKVSSYLNSVWHLIENGSYNYEEAKDSLLKMEKALWTTESMTLMNACPTSAKVIHCGRNCVVEIENMRDFPIMLGKTDKRGCHKGTIPPFSKLTLLETKCGKDDSPKSQIMPLDESSLCDITFEF